DTELPAQEAFEQRSLVEIHSGHLVTKRGEHTAISGNIAPLRDANGRPGGVVIMFEAAPNGAGEPPPLTKTLLEGKSNSIEFGRFHIVAASEPMKQVLSFAVRVARSEATTVLLEGESGTGKDLMAQFLHYSSNRRSGPFVAVNCSAIPEALLESELFGR
ncbi:MAG: sigma-54 factor interaction domain-containing protein, partial [Acidobacteriota bacterium]|nr:sigma-54 factor interaction domain-containing protein [Acidobacteriota bacterium]